MNYSVMIKPASAHCNLRCKYCFYMDECSLRNDYFYGIMKNEDGEKLVHRVLSQLEDKDSMTFAFQGGEPTLAGLDFFKSFINAVKNHSFKGKVLYALQTNGFVIDENWCEFLRENNFLVGLSLDGPIKYHDANRVDISGKGTFDTVLKAKKLMDKFNVEYNILTVLTNQLARHPLEMWNFILKNNIKYIQFVPCLEELENNTGNNTALSPSKFASFYIEIFALWAKEFKKGNYVSIKFFDDIFNLIMTHQCTACGLIGKCNIQLIVEADGCVYPCDFYVLDKWNMGSIYDKTLDELLKCKLGDEFFNRQRNDMSLCKTCDYKKICGGGCPRMKNSMYIKDNEKTCGYKTFLNACGQEISNMAHVISQQK